MRLLVLVAVLAVGAIAGCGGGDADQADAKSPSAARESTAPIVFESLSSTGGDTLFRLDQRTAKALPLDVPGSAISPDWSPDGKQITFAAEAGESQSIWTADADGGNAQEIFHCARRCLSTDYPAWSRDGNSIAFTYAHAPGSDAGPPSKTSIAVVDLESRKVRFVVTSSFPTLVDLARWSPDGKQLIIEQDRFSSDGNETGCRLAIVDVRNGDVRPLTQFSQFAFHPDWSSRGDLITFDTYDLLAFDEAPGASNVFTIRPDGSGQRQLTHFKPGGNRASAVTFTPDGQEILFTYQVGTRRNAARIASEGGAVETIKADFAGPVTHPRESPSP